MNKLILILTFIAGINIHAGRVVRDARKVENSVIILALY